MDDSPNHPAVHSPDYTLLIVGWCSRVRTASSWDIYPLLLVLLSLHISFLWDTLFFVVQSFPFSWLQSTHTATTFHKSEPPDWRDNSRSSLQDWRRWNQIQDWQCVRRLDGQLLRQYLINQECMCWILWGWAYAYLQIGLPQNLQHAMMLLLLIQFLLLSCIHLARMSDSLEPSFVPNKWCCAVQWREATGNNKRRGGGGRGVKGAWHLGEASRSLTALYKMLIRQDREFCEKLLIQSSITKYRAPCGILQRASQKFCDHKSG